LLLPLLLWKLSYSILGCESGRRDHEDDSAPRNQVKDHDLITRSVVGRVPYRILGCESGRRDHEDDSAPRNQVKDHDLITRSVVGRVPYPPVNHGLCLDCVLIQLHFGS
jgi:hypothetical protein